MSELALKLIAENKAKHERGKDASVLDLGNCGLTTIPEEVFELVWLKELHLSNRKYNSVTKKSWKSKNPGNENRIEREILPTKLFKLQYLEVLNMNGCLDNRFNISDISILQDLPNIKHVCLGYNNISNIRFLQNLKHLETLDLSHNKISNIRFLQDSEQLQILNLQSNQIKDINFLQNLKQLKSINLNRNKIINLRFLQEWKQLQNLHLSFNQISNIDFLRNLRQLQTLDLSFNKINDINSLHDLKHLYAIDLSSNEISDCSFMQNFKQLQTLNLHSNQISDISFLQNLRQLQTLDLSDNQISDVSCLRNLNQLKILDLDNNHVSDIGFLQELKCLHDLNLSSNEINDYSLLQNLLRVKNLSLQSNQIRDISFLQDLKQLQTLDLSMNKISDISSLKYLDQLQSLNLRSNQIKDYSLLQNMRELQTLNLRSNKISNISFLLDLKQLHNLDLSVNKISDISYLKDLKQLKTLDLSVNQISDIRFLEDLKQLQTLDLSDNQINDVNFLQNLDQLKILDLDKNDISDVKDLKELIVKGLNPVLKAYPSKGEKEIVLGVNPLSTPPPEIIKKGREAVLDYFKELEQQGEDYLYEAKVLIVGDARVGKTTLCRKLKSQKAKLPTENETTHGIDITPMRFRIGEKDYTANVWDFGGQDIYQSTHQFFLTKRSLYVFVDDNSRDDIDYDYWFQIVESLSNRCPVIVVQNKKADRAKAFDERGFKGRYPNIKEVFSLNLSLKNLEDKKELDRLQKSIQHHLCSLPHIGNKLPKQWVAIRKEIEKRSHIVNSITIKEYQELCTKFKIPEKERAMSLSSYLHDLGAFLHFQDDDLLNKTVLLNKEWATNAVYEILDDKKISENAGIFNRTDAIQIWKGTDYEDSHAEFLCLMRNFELYYKIPNIPDEKYLIPGLLPVEEPIFEWDYSSNLRMRFEYEFMPKGLLSRFIVRRHIYAKELGKIWRRGVVLAKNNSETLIKEEYGCRKIEVRAKGPHARDLMTIVRDEFECLHSNFEGLVVKKLIPCNCEVCYKNGKPHFYNYNSLLRRIEKNKPTVECDISYEDVRIEQLLDGVFVEEFREEEPENTPAGTKTISIFLASSAELEKDRQEFENFINRQNKRLINEDIFLYLEIWEDFIDAMSQERLQEEYNKTIRDCDIFLSLLHTKVGMYTAEEFETAFGQFKATGKPLVYTYFKNGQVDMSKLSEQINTRFAFEKKLKDLGHFPSQYDSIADLKEKFWGQLDKILPKL